MLKMKKASRQDKRRLANSAVAREAITKENVRKNQRKRRKGDDVVVTQSIAKKAKTKHTTKTLKKKSA